MKFQSTIFDIKINNAVQHKSDIVLSFEKYKNIIFNVDVDLNFWTDFLDRSIATYQKQTNIPDKIYEAMFVAYHLDISSNVGYLKGNPVTRSIHKSDLKRQRLIFFAWIRNLAILKSYNALEILLIEVIWINFFQNEKNPTINKKSADNIQMKIKEQLSLAGMPSDTRNNRHLIEFIKLKISAYSTFLQNPLNIDLLTTWGNYFEMISVFRNIIAHQGTVINDDTLNEIKSKAKDIFIRHFDVIKDEFNQKHLQPKEDNFSSFISITNTFALNSIKLMANENDFKFLNMY